MLTNRNSINELKEEIINLFDGYSFYEVLIALQELTLSMLLDLQDNDYEEE